MHTDSQTRAESRSASGSCDVSGDAGNHDLITALQMTFYIASLWHYTITKSSWGLFWPRAVCCPKELPQKFCSIFEGFRRVPRCLRCFHTCNNSWEQTRLSLTFIQTCICNLPLQADGLSRSAQVRCFDWIVPLDPSRKGIQLLYWTQTIPRRYLNQKDCYLQGLTRANHTWFLLEGSPWSDRMLEFNRSF